MQSGIDHRPATTGRVKSGGGRHANYTKSHGHKVVQRELSEVTISNNKLEKVNNLLSMNNKALSKDQEIILVCGAGGMAALTGKTMMEMGYTNIKNVGGIGDWIKAEGPLEK